MARLDNRVAIVTGGGWNVGRGIARAFAAAGARVVVASRNAANLDETVRQIRDDGGVAAAIPTDVTDAAQVEALVGGTLDLHGRVDVFAAIAGGGWRAQPLERMDPRAWDEVFRTNATSAFYSARAVLPWFGSNDAGTLLFCSGGGGFHPVLGQELAAYGAAKAAVCRLTDQLTAELWSTGIRVHCIDPGLVWDPDTLAAIEREEAERGQPHPQRELYRPPEAAGELAAWLASDASRPIRGRLVSVYDSWWRDPERVRAVHDSIHLYRLRRHEL